MSKNWHMGATPTGNTDWLKRSVKGSKNVKPLSIIWLSSDGRTSNKMRIFLVSQAAIRAWYVEPIPTRYNTGCLRSLSPCTTKLDHIGRVRTHTRALTTWDCQEISPRNIPIDLFPIWRLTVIHSG